MFYVSFSFQLPPDEPLGGAAAVVLFYFYLTCSVFNHIRKANLVCYRALYQQRETFSP